MSLKRISRTTGIPVRQGDRVYLSRKKKRGKIVGSNGSRVLVRLNGERTAMSCRLGELRFL